MSKRVTKAISGYAPWMWALIYGFKDVENRSKSFPNIQERVWVHCSYGPSSKREWEAEYEAMCRLLIGVVVPSFEKIWAMRGHIIGSIDVTGRLSPTQSSNSRWRMWGSTALVVADPKPLVTPVHAIGRLGVWTVPPHTLAQLEKQVA